MISLLSFFYSSILARKLIKSEVPGLHLYFICKNSLFLCAVKDKIMEPNLDDLLVQEAQNSEWKEWVGTVIETARQIDLRNPKTWGGLSSLAENISAMSWLIGKLQKLCPRPSLRDRTEAALYILANYCRANKALGYVTDTYCNYYKAHDAKGVLACARILHSVSPGEEYPHLNFLYDLMTANVINEFKRYLSADNTFMSEADFRLAGKYIPDFKGMGFREMVLIRFAPDMTGRELAAACHMSNTVFREHFKEEFGMNVSQWLRSRKKERIEKMLRNPSIPLFRVAENNGFKSESTFSDYCRRNFDKTPMQLRKQLLQNGNRQKSEKIR